MLMLENIVCGFTAHMIRKGQLTDKNIPVYKQFMALAG
jgi:hypothetical protein